MKNIYYLFLCLFIFVLVSCSGSSGKTGTPGQLPALLQSNYRLEKIRDLYTAGTIGALRSYADSTGMDNNELLGILSIIPEKALFEVSVAELNASEAKISVKFTSGVSENVRGLIVDLSAKKENGQWKIDRTEDFRRMSRLRNRNSEGKSLDSYLKH